MTPEEIKAGHTYQCIGNPDCLVLSVGDDSVTYRDCYGVAESGLAVFASLCVRDVTPAPESDQGEKVAQAQSQGASCGDGGGPLLFDSRPVQVSRYGVLVAIYADSNERAEDLKAAVVGFLRGSTAAGVNAELLAACKRHYDRIQQWLETGVPAGPDESRSITEQLGAAIAKAEGRQ